MANPAVEDRRELVEGVEQQRLGLFQDEIF